MLRSKGATGAGAVRQNDRTVAGMSAKYPRGDRLDAPGRDVADRREDHLIGGVRAPHEGVDVLRAVAGQCRLRAQNVVSQCRSGEEQVFEIVVDAVGGRILVGVDLVEDHLAFAFQFPFGKGRTERHVGEQFDGFGEVAAQHGGACSVVSSLVV